MHAGSRPPDGNQPPDHRPLCAFFTASGDQVLLAVQSEGEWLRFCTTVLGGPGSGRRPPFSANERRVEHRDLLDELIKPALAAMDDRRSSPASIEPHSPTPE